ncbi:protein RETICULATA-RELATED 3, chloroplastic-like [Phragmites australis]|uniref:protein RETICULATA-RELATED 3, chloroplastic-like n=1 Tax=Phragmites australis TaxID=29695 RepID=UPI002D77A645|nr:protein RETICULATA-RELATED 3, chloroplastic-like [Phragmites australis]
MASTAFAAAKFLPAHLDSSPRTAPHRTAPTANFCFSPLPASSSSSSASLLRLLSPYPSGPGGRLPPPPPPRSYGGGGSGDAADSGGDARKGGILGLFLAGWAARVAADPQFPFKVLMEELVGVTACVLGDMASRPNFGLNELDFVFSTLVVGSILNFVLMYLLAPTAGVAAAASSVASALPSHMFEPGAYSLGSRVATLLSKGATFAAVGFAAGLAGTAISNGLIAMRKRMDPAFETPNKPPPTLLNAATWALHMGVSSNLRYQSLNGIEYLLGKVAPAPIFKVSVVALRCMNNVLGGMSFVLLARLTGSQRSDKPVVSTVAEEKERLIAVGNAAADAISEGRDGDGK